MKTNNDTDAKFQLVTNIVNTLSDKEREYLCDNEEYINSKYVVFRNVTNDAFVDVYVVPPDPHVAYLTLAAKPQARGTGITDRMVHQTLVEISKKFKTISKIYWQFSTSNRHSHLLGLRCGFKQITLNLLEYKIIRKPSSN